MKPFHLRKDIVNAVLVLCLAVLVLAFGYFTITLAVDAIVTNGKPENLSQEGMATSYVAGTYVKNPSISTLLVLGLDSEDPLSSSGGYTNDKQSDFIALFVFDNSKETYRILQINRDTMTNIPILGVTLKPVGSAYAQITLAYHYGDGMESSVENTKSAVSELLDGVEINQYFVASMGAVPMLNHAVGGVTVTVNHDFSQVDPTIVQGETITLSDEQAMTYVRSRQLVEDGTNVLRMERQQQYLLALYEQVSAMGATGSASEVNDSLTLLEEVSPYTLTDCSSAVLSRLEKNLGAYEFEGIVTIDGTAVLGEKFQEFYLDEQDLAQVLLDLFYVQK